MSVENLKNLLEKYENRGGNFQKVSWFTLKNDGDTATVRFLSGGIDDLEVHEVHRFKIDGYDRSVKCLGDDCPACRAGEKTSLRLWLPLVNLSEEDKDKQLQMWERGFGDIKKVVSVVEEYGDLNKRDIKIKRNGRAGNTKTFYDYFPKDKSERELPESPKVLGWFVLDLTPDQIKEVMAGTFTLKKADADNAEKKSDENVF